MKIAEKAANYTNSFKKLEHKFGLKRSPCERSWTGQKGGGKRAGCGVVSKDEKVCYYCQKPGHIAKHCPEKAAEAPAKAAANARVKNKE